MNPTHLDHCITPTGQNSTASSPTACSAVRCSPRCLARCCPEPARVYLGQDLRFRRTVKPGDILTARVVVREKHADNNRVVLDCVCTNQNGKEVISGTAEVIAPTEKVRRERMAMPEVSLVRHAAYDAPAASRAADWRRCRPPSSIRAIATVCGA